MAPAQVRLIGSGPILREALRAAECLAADWGVAAEAFSATSFSELARDAREVERHNRLHPNEDPRLSWLDETLPGDAPIVAATDYVRAWPQLIASYTRAPFVALGTDGFGRSDTRQALRRFFEVDRYSIVATALWALARAGKIDRKLVGEALARYDLQHGGDPPWLA